jgi:shikimate kinase
MGCIFLIGFMASGKSTIGKALSTLLGASSLDIDTEVARREGMPIHQIFSKKGEPYFRKLETAVLREFGSSCGGRTTIIATGGGLPCTGSNMEYMNERGITVYLKSSFDDIVSRVEHVRDRPVFHRIGSRRGLEELLRKRETYYSRAHVIIENRNDIPPQQIAEHIARVIAQ